MKYWRNKMNGIEGIKKMNSEADERERDYEYKQCADCIHRMRLRRKDEPSPCKSCEQPAPTNFEEE
jgi:hypothetical protein